MPGISVKLPLRQDEIDGLYEMNKTLAEVTRQDLKMLVYTAPGERIMEPEYGVGIFRWLFENVEERELFQADIVSNMSEQVSRWMPYVRLEHVDFNYSEDSNPHLLSMKIHYTNVPLGNTDVLNIDSEFVM